MRTGASDVPSLGLRKGLRLDARLRKARRDRMRRGVLESLEDRTLLAVVPAPQAAVFNTVSQSGGNVSSPTVVVDRYNPNNLFAVWTRNDPDLAPGNVTVVEGAYSSDGGQDWTNLGTGAGPGLQIDPAIVPGPGVNQRFAQTLDPQVAFDNQHNVYVLVRQANAANTSGALVLRKFDFPGPNPDGTGAGGTPTWTGDVIVRQYVVDPVFNPTLTVDDNLASFTDPDTGNVQTDPFAGNVWVGWSTREARPTGTAFDQTPNGQVWNANSIQVVTSSDGGRTFSAATQANNQNRWTGPTGIFADATPQIAVGQGKSVPAAQAAANAGGGAVVVWDNFGRYNASATNPQDVPDLIQSNAVSGGTAYTVAGGTGPIANSPSSAAPFDTATTDFNIPVNFTGAAMNEVLSKLTVNMTLQQENMAWISAVLIAPDGRTVTLFSNAQGSDGTAPPADYTFGVTGTDLGIVGTYTQNNVKLTYGAIGSTFDDEAARSINDRSGAGTGYTGYFRTEAQRGGAANGLAKFNGATLGSLNSFVDGGGVTHNWVLRITAYGNNGSSTTALASRLRDLSLTFTTGVEADGGAETVAATQVRGSQTGVYPRASAAAGTQGIGPGIDVTQNNTLGSFSQYQGWIYVAYTGFRTGPFSGLANPADNTEIYLAWSDDGGQTWNRRFNPLTGEEIPVNDDQGSIDGFSGANSNASQGQIVGRAQFLPQVAVDQATGTLVMSWRDGRDDSARTRSSVYVGASIDGGSTFSQQSYANPAQTAFDPITQKTIALNPAGDNPGGSDPASTTFGYGTQMGLAVAGGQVFLAWGGNLNRSHLNSSNVIVGDTMRTFVERMTVAAGPRVVDSSQGPIDTANGVSINSFVVTLDRPIDAPGFAASFTPADVTVYYRGTSNNDPYVPIAATSVTPVASSLVVVRDPVTGQVVKTLGYTQFTVTFPTQTAVGTYSYIITPQVSDRIRTVTIGLDGSVAAIKDGNEIDQNADGVAGQDPLAFASGAPYLGFTPGDYYTTPALARPEDALFWSNVAGGPSVPGSLTAQILGSKTLAASLPLILPGAHVIGTEVENHADGAGSGTPLVPRSYPSPQSNQPIPAFNQLTSPLTVPDAFTATDLTVTVNLTSPDLSSLRLTLVAPDGTTVPLVPLGGLQGTNLTGAVFSDSAMWPVDYGSAPYTGTFRPVGGAFSNLVGKSVYGTWRLVVFNVGPLTSGRLVGWTLGATTPDFNLTLNDSASHQTVVFDRPIRTSSFTADDVLQIMGPTGSLLGPQYFQSDKSGQAIPAPPSSTVPGVLESTLTIPTYLGGTFVASNLTVSLGLTFPNLSGLRIDLVAPDGVTIVPLVLAGGLQGANLTGTVFDDSAARTITNGTAPYTGAFRPSGGSLSSLVGNLQGIWRLRITNTAARTVGTLTGWSLGATPTISVTPVNPTTVGGVEVATAFNVNFPTRVLSGTYTIQLGSDITDVNGQKIDRNLNAGLDVRRGEAPLVPVTPVSYGARTSEPPDGTTLVKSTIQVPDNFPVQGTTTSSGVSGLRLLLTLSSPDVSKLTATLTHNGVSVTLFANLIQGTDAGGFTNVIFDDRAASPISQASPPYTGASFNPLMALLNGGFENATSGGAWVLTIEGTSPTAQASLSSWSLLFQKPLPTSGLGEPVADQTSSSFRIFQTDLTNDLSHNTWTSVGAASVLPNSVEGTAGRISALAQDPSDPTGNTFYIGGASGGVWKTTNFLTTDRNGPTYVPLTDFGPTSGLNVGAIAVFPRNNDPNQSIVIASTGEGDRGTAGVGFLISKDGGATWRLLDSSTNVDGAGAPLPLNSPARDHVFVGATTFKVVVDPKLTLQGQVIIYAAVGGPNGGLWRSVDSGDHWTLMRAGQATDVVLDPTSKTGGGDDPNLLTLYAGFQGDGVYVSPNRGQSWNPLSGGVGNPLLIDLFKDGPVPVANGGVSPMGANGRIALAKPALTGNTNQDALYAGWIYAAVANGGGTAISLYMSKDFGQNWVRVRFPSEPRAADFTPTIPSNSLALADYDLANGTANISLGLTVDPSNPNIVYLGGSQIPTSASGVIRIDVTRIWDAYNLTLYSAVAPDGLTDWNSTGPVTPGDRLAALPSTVVPPTIPPPGFVNYIRDPYNPFVAGATRFVYNLNQFANNGFGAAWTPFDQFVAPGAAPVYDTLMGAGQVPTYEHMVTFIDPTTGMTRLVFGTNRGVWSVLDDDGKPLVGQSVGTVPTPGASRNGNLAVAQYFYGAAQPSALALSAQANYDKALFYASGNDQDQYSSGTILGDGNLIWDPNRGPNPITGLPMVQGVFGGGVAVDPQGLGTLYQAFQANTMLANMDTTFFQVNHVTRTFGLIPAAGDLAQWNATSGATFAVNPLSGQQLIISAANGRIYSTTDQGTTWFLIGDSGTFGGPSTYSKALAYGAPEPGATVGNLGNFMYVGTAGGRVFITQTGGGGQGNDWTEVSAGLDGSAVQRIVPSPTRGNHSAYAVTQLGVYYIADSTAAGATWTAVTGNLRTLPISIFGESYAMGDGDPLSQSLTLSALAVDWRYLIPNSSGDPVGPGLHPVLYVAGDAGVFRSLDNGATWSLFPNTDVDAAQVQGGLLPRSTVTDLDLSVGAINPATGVSNLMGALDPTAPGSANDPNLLYATTWGRSAYAIRLAPLVLPGTTRVNPADVSGVAPDGSPIVKSSSFGISGLSMTTGFGNATRITIYSVTDGKVVAGFDPANPTATNVAANWTDINGNFNIQIPQGAITTNGAKVFQIRATDDTGSIGNTITLELTLDASDLEPPNAPITPTLALNPADNTGLVPADNFTNKPTPTFQGVTSKNASVRLYYSTDGGATWLPGSTGVSSTAGTFAIPLTDSNGVPLPDGTYMVTAIATNSKGSSPSASPVTIHIKVHGPTTAPSLGLSPGSDSGIVGDGVTNVHMPFLYGSVGAADANSFIRIYRAGTQNTGPILAQTTSNGVGDFAVRLAQPLNNGVIALTAVVVDQAGNVGPASTSPLTISVVTTRLDYSGSDLDAGGFVLLSQSQGALFYRNQADGVGQWYGKPTPTSTLPTWFSNGRRIGAAGDVPVVGDFDADGKEDLATYTPSTQTWHVSMSGGGSQSFSFGVGPATIPLTGNFDGVGATQYGTFDVVGGQGSWQMTSSSGGLQAFVFGKAGDVPLTGDFLGRGYDQAAVYRPSTGEFRVYDKANPGADGQLLTTMAPNQIPVPGYYENLAYKNLGQPYRMVPAVFNAATGTFTVARLSGSTFASTAVFKPGDVPAPGDYFGLGWDLPTVYRPSTGSFLTKQDQTQPTGADAVIVGFPGTANLPVVPAGAPLAYRMSTPSPLEAAPAPAPVLASAPAPASAPDLALALAPASALASASTPPAPVLASVPTPTPTPAPTLTPPAPAAVVVTPSLAVSPTSPAGARQPVFAGVAAPGTTVVLTLSRTGQRGSRGVGTATADAAGSYSFQIPAGFPLGSYALVASALGAGGQTTPIASTTFRIAPAAASRAPMIVRPAPASRRLIAGRPARPTPAPRPAAAPGALVVGRLARPAVAPAQPVEVDPVGAAISSLLDSRPRGSMRK